MKNDTFTVIPQNMQRYEMSVRAADNENDLYREAFAATMKEDPLVETRDQILAADFFMNGWEAAVRCLADDSVEPDDIAIDKFAAAMKAKMAASRAKGRGGWDDPAQCTIEKLAAMLCQHVEKGDPVDIANFAMMIHQRGGTAIDVYEALAVFLNARPLAFPESKGD